MVGPELLKNFRFGVATSCRNYSSTGCFGKLRVSWSETLQEELSMFKKKASKYLQCEYAYTPSPLRQYSVPGLQRPQTFPV